MNIELTYLVYTAILSVLLWIPYITNRMFLWGIGTFIGNYPEGYPEKEPIPPMWAQRSKRAHLNLVETLPAFAAVVLVATIVSPGSESAICWAKIFFISRIIHAVVYTLGVPYLRTPVYLVGWFSILMIGFGVL
ncbi:MAPEG family protein [Halobacteriovorax sp. JY17]|uniref:MAPEG family protein n=1 Tax=Halobacteriovorax sp. JY17 TaxID=2014617 RepID=UPI000C3E8D97|nr:MAPEG family protein [Halobacteriovorax sp. JY17]PIK13502.1 MAG: hypothetical protein CES88_16415 [Halobacteriovorax sp. JY17]